jgi:hypothetical protein
MFLWQNPTAGYFKAFKRKLIYFNCRQKNSIVFVFPSDFSIRLRAEPQFNSQLYSWSSFHECNELYEASLFSS